MYLIAYIILRYELLLLLLFYLAPIAPRFCLVAVVFIMVAPKVHFLTLGTPQLQPTVDKARGVQGGIAEVSIAQNNSTTSRTQAVQQQ